MDNYGNYEKPATYVALRDAVKGLPNDLRACLIELMNAGVKFVAGEWGRCPMTTLGYAKRDGECDVPGTLLASNEQMNLVDEMGIGSSESTTKAELARLLNVPTQTVGRFARAWDGHVDAMRETLEDYVGNGLGSYSNETHAALSHTPWLIDHLRQGARDSALPIAVQQAHTDLRRIIEVDRPEFVQRYTLRVSMQVTADAGSYGLAEQRVRRALVDSEHDGGFGIQSVSVNANEDDDENN